ncbi:MAG: glycosyltransferase family 2 protein [Deferribacteraceae bacterium]|jgi:glycosyltransferase involved in cell wall biosynthesis|nr:glycosyltransferase family 2 protein [Deferribacteraceae bacterium]
MKLSVAIITYNEEENIARTINAAKAVADEIIVMDSDSSDKTREISESLGAKVYLQPWLGYSEQKNLCNKKCSGEWILSLDADEVLTEEAAEAILKAVPSGTYDGYRINRRTYYMGKLLRYSWQPDKHLRLVRKGNNPRWEGLVHEVFKIDGRVGDLKGDIIHYSYKDFAGHMSKSVQFAHLAAVSYNENGKHSGGAAILFRPFFALLKRLILKRGILDGPAGIIAALSSAYYTYMKYSFLWELERKKDGEGL